MWLLHCHRAWRFTSVMRVGIWPETEVLKERTALFFFFDEKKYCDFLRFLENAEFFPRFSAWWLEFVCLVLSKFVVRLQRHTVSDASEVVGQLHAANTKCIENFSLLKPQNLMKQSMTCTLKIHEKFIKCVCVVFHCLVGFGTSGTSIHNCTLCVFLLILSHIVYKIDIIYVLPNSRCFFIAPLFWIVWRMRSLLD